MHQMDMHVTFYYQEDWQLKQMRETWSKLKAKQDSNAYRKSQGKEEAEKIADKLSKILVKINVKAGANGKNIWWCFAQKKLQKI